MSAGLSAVRGPVARLGVLLALLVALVSCRTVAPLAPANLSEPGWRTQTGQAVWRPRHDAPELAGELLVATHPDGRSVVQFTKTPLPFVVVLTTARTWQIEFVPQHRTFSGPGRPPARLLWLHLARHLAGEPSAGKISWRTLPDQHWRLENSATGETIEGFLAP